MGHSKTQAITVGETTPDEHDFWPSASSSLLINLFEIMDAVLILVDPQQRIQWASRKSGLYFGQAYQSMLGSDLREWVSEELMNMLEEPVRFAQAMQRSRQSTRPMPAEECHLLAGPDRAERWMEYQSYLLEQAPYKDWRVEVLRDVSERKKAQRVMLDASRMEATTQVVAGLVHDFNNLMVGVIGNAELVRPELGHDAESRAAIDDITSAAQRAGDLARQLLSFTRGAKSQPKPLNLNASVIETLQLHRRMIPEIMQIDLDLDPRLWNIEADPAQVGLLTMNLCNNAVEATEERGALHITTHNLEIDADSQWQYPSLALGQYVSLSFQDIGRGMSTEVLERATEPFFSTKYRGGGLGLTAVAGIVQSLGGLLQINSQPGVGTTVRLILPASSEDVAVSPPQQPLPMGTETILLVDDESLVLEVTRKQLTGFGYHVLAARNASEALELAQTHPAAIPLAILDLGMPGMGGHELFPLLRMSRPEMKLIICSGFAMDGLIEDLLEQGASAFLPKPFKFITMGQTIRRVLDGQG